MIEHLRSVSFRPWALLGAAVALTSACDLLTAGKEPLSGTGPRAMDPYMGRPSGAIRLQLQSYNGCGMRADGTPTGPGSIQVPIDGGASPAFIYPYADKCTNTASGLVRPSRELAPMPIVAGVPYFLDQITLVEATNIHKDPANLAAPLDWLRTKTRFKNLDWTGFGVIRDEWQPDRSLIGGASREVQFGGAAWMSHAKHDPGSEDLHDFYLVEFLDANGDVKASQKYPSGSFAIHNSTHGHTMFSFSYSGVGKPEFLGDTRLNPLPPQPVGSGSARPVSFRTLARLDLATQTQPFKRTMTLPEDLRGDGVARVTWSAVAGEPFYFPVRFTHPTEPDFPQCWDPTDATKRVPCDFGNDPQATFSKPRNGKDFYEPGETFQMNVRLLDGMGNLLHPPDSLPSYADFLADRTNGILYNYSGNTGTFGERNVWSSMSVNGPIQLMRPNYLADNLAPWFSQWGRGTLPNSATTGRSGSAEIPGETRWPVDLPADAKPGTYVAIVKVNRQFMGERLTRTKTLYFQVGQSEKTSYPKRVGNCDICHRGPTALANVSMGMATGEVEACKSCHFATFPRLIHLIHMESEHYPMKKNDCAVCHLTRESALRASILVCTTCHLQAHAGQFFNQMLLSANVAGEPNLQTNCGATCHGLTTPPSQHLLPISREKN